MEADFQKGSSPGSPEVGADCAMLCSRRMSNKLDKLLRELVFKALEFIQFSVALLVLLLSRM